MYPSDCRVCPASADRSPVDEQRITRRRGRTRRDGRALWIRAELEHAAGQRAALRRSIRPPPRPARARRRASTSRRLELRQDLGGPQVLDSRLSPPTTMLVHVLSSDSSSSVGHRGSLPERPFPDRSCGAVGRNVRGTVARKTRSKVRLDTRRSIMTTAINDMAVELSAGELETRYVEMGEHGHPSRVASRPAPTSAPCCRDCRATGARARTGASSWRARSSIEHADGTSRDGARRRGLPLAGRPHRTHRRGCRLHRGRPGRTDEAVRRACADSDGRRMILMRAVCAILRALRPVRPRAAAAPTSGYVDAAVAASLAASPKPTLRPTSEVKSR